MIRKRVLPAKALLPVRLIDSDIGSADSRKTRSCYYRSDRRRRGAISSTQQDCGACLLILISALQHSGAQKPEEQFIVVSHRRAEHCEAFVPREAADVLLQVTIQAILFCLRKLSVFALFVSTLFLQCREWPTCFAGIHRQVEGTRHCRSHVPDRTGRRRLQRFEMHQHPRSLVCTVG